MFTDEPAVATLDRMARKKRSGGDHTTPRRPVQYPAEWYKVAQKLANRRPMPTIWYLIELLKKDAELAGIDDLPPTPWEESQESGFEK